MMNRVTLNIGGMTCGGCVASIDKVLNAVAGVRQVQVDLASATAVIEYDAAQTEVAALIDAVENAGFDAQAT